ncbi:hypothetical protein HYH03_002010 [Edaphochlamys debaryana]|uniref:AAA+ ATPase domain-containing protein n=1 Tax=Edaphochlamys debaryana TaxID=47281 RepID=A0A836C681_9CHLO|nr:hypothetical protein HYH03_002010 [Edaphochlamys debaryana]|eukprot:KAG2500442.1 hypothetical protein HYH03_002010 [Edaphochlamys debaryana]
MERTGWDGMDGVTESQVRARILKLDSGSSPRGEGGEGSSNSGEDGEGEGEAEGEAEGDGDGEAAGAAADAGGGAAAVGPAEAAVADGAAAGLPAAAGTAATSGTVAVAAGGAVVAGPAASGAAAGGSGAARAPAGGTGRGAAAAGSAKDNASGPAAQPVTVSRVVQCLLRFYSIKLREYKCMACLRKHSSNDTVSLHRRRIKHWMGLDPASERHVDRAAQMMIQQLGDKVAQPPDDPLAAEPTHPFMMQLWKTLLREGRPMCDWPTPLELERAKAKAERRKVREARDTPPPPDEPRRKTHAPGRAGTSGRAAAAGGTGTASSSSGSGSGESGEEESKEDVETLTARLEKAKAREEALSADLAETLARIESLHKNPQASMAPLQAELEQVKALALSQGFPARNEEAMGVVEESHGRSRGRYMCPPRELRDARTAFRQAGLALKPGRYHVAVVGPPGTGKTSLVNGLAKLLCRRAALSGPGRLPHMATAMDGSGLASASVARPPLTLWDCPSPPSSMAGAVYVHEQHLCAFQMQVIVIDKVFEKLHSALLYALRNRLTTQRFAVVFVKGDSLVEGLCQAEPRLTLDGAMSRLRQLAMKAAKPMTSGASMLPPENVFVLSAHSMQAVGEGVPGVQLQLEEERFVAAVLDAMIDDGYQYTPGSMAPAAAASAPGPGPGAEADPMTEAADLTPGTEPGRGMEESLQGGGSLAGPEGVAEDVGAGGLTPGPGPSGAGPSGAGPSAVVPNGAGPIVAAPSVAGPISAGPSTAGPNGTGPSGTGPSGVDPNAAGPISAGPSTAGPNGTGPSGTGPSGVDPNAAGPISAGPSTAGPNGTGPSGTGPSGVDPNAAGPISAGPSTAVPFGLGGSGASPSTAGPSGAGPSGAGPSGAGPSAAGPSGPGPSVSRERGASPGSGDHIGGSDLGAGARAEGGAAAGGSMEVVVKGAGGSADAGGGGGGAGRGPDASMDSDSDVEFVGEFPPPPARAQPAILKADADEWNLSDLVVARRPSRGLDDSVDPLLTAARADYRRCGLNLDPGRYNVAVVGLPGTGKTTLVQGLARLMSRRAGLAAPGGLPAVVKSAGGGLQTLMSCSVPGTALTLWDCPPPTPATAAAYSDQLHLAAFPMQVLVVDRTMHPLHGIMLYALKTRFPNQRLGVVFAKGDSVLAEMCRAIPTLTLRTAILWLRQQVLEAVQQVTPGGFPLAPEDIFVLSAQSMQSAGEGVLGVQMVLEEERFVSAILQALATDGFLQAPGGPGPAAAAAAMPAPRAESEPQPQADAGTASGRGGAGALDALVAAADLFLAAEARNTAVPQGRSRGGGAASGAGAGGGSSRPAFVLLSVSDCLRPIPAMPAFPVGPDGQVPVGAWFRAAAGEDPGLLLQVAPEGLRCYQAVGLIGSAGGAPLAPLAFQ